MPHGILTNAANIEAKRISVPNPGITDFQSNSSSQMNVHQYSSQQQMKPLAATMVRPSTAGQVKDRESRSAI